MVLIFFMMIFMMRRTNKLYKPMMSLGVSYVAVLPDSDARTGGLPAVAVCWWKQSTTSTQCLFSSLASIPESSHIVKSGIFLLLQIRVIFSFPAEPISSENNPIVEESNSTEREGGKVPGSSLLLCLHWEIPPKKLWNQKKLRMPQKIEEKKQFHRERRG